MFLKDYLFANMELDRSKTHMGFWFKMKKKKKIKAMNVKR